MPIDFDIHNSLEYIPRMFKVLTKALEGEASSLVPMVLWPSQKYYIQNRTHRDIILKSRQHGTSTGIMADNAHKLFTQPYQRASIITHDQETSEFLFQTVQRFYRNLPSDMRPETDWKSGSRMRFPQLDSYIYIDSAKSDSLGIGHTLNIAHLSEVAKWPPRKAEGLFADISQTVSEGGFISVECYDGETEVLTEKGWRKFNQCNEDCLVLTKDNNNNAYYVKPTQFIRGGLSESLISFKSRHIDLMVTPYHQMWVLGDSRWGNRGKLRFASDLTQRPRLKFDTSLNWCVEDSAYLEIPSYKATYHNKRDLPLVSLNADDWCEYMGYFISEGWVSSSQVAIGQNINSRYYPGMKDCVKRIAKQFGKECKEYINKNCAHLIINDMRLVDYLKDYTKPKRIPRELLMLSARQLRIFLEAYFCGDGEINRNRCFTKYKELADDLQELGLKLGFNVTIKYRKWKPDFREGFNGLIREGYNVSFINGFPCVKRHEIKTTDISVPVYCFNLPTGHLMMVRRNNKAVWCGNSTPRGRGGLFFDLYDSAKKGDINYKTFFFPWWWDVTCKRTTESLKYTKEEQELVNYVRQRDNMELTKEQIAFRREKIAELRDLFYQEYPENDVDCWLSSEISAFDGIAIRSYLKQIFEGRKEGNLTIWKDVLGGEKYVIGVDVAAGKAKGDYSVAAVLNVKRNEYVARLRGRIPPALFAEELMRVGQRYNMAQLGVERTGHGHLVLRTLLENNYPEIYYHLDYDSVLGQTSSEPGWKTSIKTKPIMVGDLGAALTAGDLGIWSENFLLEASAMTWEGQEKVKKPASGFDDEVDALMIALQLREQAPIMESRRYKPETYAIL